MSNRYFFTSVTRRRFDSKTYRLEPYAEYEDATVRSISHHGMFGSGYMLRIAIDEDPETGTKFDADGDRALERIEMYGAVTSDFGDCSRLYKGFVQNEIDDGDIGVLPEFHWEFEEWYVAPRGRP